MQVHFSPPPVRCPKVVWKLADLATKFLLFTQNQKMKCKKKTPDFSGAFLLVLSLDGDTHNAIS